MKKHTLKRYLASLLAVLMLISVAGISPAVFADSYEQPVLVNGSGIIVSSADTATVKKTLAKALISNYDNCNPNTRDNLDWEYECVGWQEIDVAHKLANNTAFGDIGGFTSSTSKKVGLITTTTKYKHDALSAQPDNSNYRVRLKSNTNIVVSFTKLQPQELQVTLNSNVSVVMPYTGATSVDYAVLEQRVLDAAIKSTNYTLTRSNTDITYYATKTIAIDYHAWVPLAGGKDTIEYPAVSEGTQKVKLSFKGEGAYTAKDIELNVTFTGRQDASYTLKDSPSVGLKYTDATNIDYSTINADVFNAVFANITPQLSASDVTITYWASLKTGSLTEVDKDWMPLTGGKKTVGIDYEYAAVTEGTHKVKIVWGGNANYNGFTVEKEVTFTGRQDASYTLKDSPSVGLKYTDATTIDYSSINADVFNAVFADITPQLSASDVTITYLAELKTGSLTDLDKAWVSLSGDSTHKAVTEGAHKVKIVWGGNANYNGFTVEREVTFTGRDDVPAVSPTSFEVKAAFNDDQSIKYESVRQAIWAQIEDKLPDNITYDKVSFAFKYVFAIDYWLTFEGSAADADVDTAIFGDANPRLKLGENTIRVKWAGDSKYNPYEQYFTVNVVDGREDISISFVANPSVTLVFNASGIDNEAAKADIWKVVASLNPESVKSSITVKYDGTDINSNPSYSEGSHTLNFSYAGSADYKPFSKDVSVTFVDNRAPSFKTKDNTPSEIAVGFNDDQDYDVNITLQNIRKALVEQLADDLSLDQVVVKCRSSLDVAGVSKYDDLSYTGLKALMDSNTKLDIKLSYAGDATHKPYDSGEIKGIKLKDMRAAAPFTVNVPEEGVSLVFNNDTSLNYAGIENAIRAIVTSSDENLGVENLTVKYESSPGLYNELNYGIKSSVLEKAFGEGKFNIKLTWGGSSQYKPFEWSGDIEFKDNRIQSVVKYVENASITFNMVGDQMLQAIFNDVIDKAGSTLPEGLTYKDFTYEYKVITVYKVRDLELGHKEEWVPIVGDDGYPNMNADEENGQTIRISYKGNADYKGCANEGSVKVMKANVKVSVKRLTVMHVGDTELPDNFITLDPNDTRSIEVYTFFVGVNTNKEATVYLMLPESKTKLIEAISKAQEFLNISPTLEEQLNDGMTIGELRAALDSIVNSPALNNKLGQMAFDGFMKLMGYNFTYAQFKSLYDTMSQIASLADNLRLALGSPTHAGIYQAIAITVSDNYNRAYGTGTVLVLMTWKDVKLQKNSALGDNNTITVSQAEQLKADNNLCVLTRNGNELDGEYVGNIHYWFTGVNRIYARSEMPTTPGKYIVTASVRGGDYYATPKTFIFTITAD